MARDQVVLGNLWAADADDAAGWQERPGAGDAAYDAAVPWIVKLREKKARGPFARRKRWLS